MGFTLGNRGYLRKIDQLGRIVIPIDFRRIYNIKEGDLVEIEQSEGGVYIKKHIKISPCVITGKVSSHNIKLPGDVSISPEGLEILLELIEHKKSKNNLNNNK